MKLLELPTLKFDRSVNALINPEHITLIEPHENNSNQAIVRMIEYTIVVNLSYDSLKALLIQEMVKDIMSR